MTEHPPVNRRTVLVAGATTAGAAALAACGGGSSQPAVAGPGASGGSAATPSGPSTSPTAGATAGAVLLAVSDVPVGGSAAATDAAGKHLVVAQPKAGEFVAFSAVCTHMGCTVAPDGKQLRCPCHGSVYDAFTGAVVSGPAPQPLPPVPVEVKGGEVVEA
jgi:cytochrome b6-f complex iron-sulfur subunit